MRTYILFVCYHDCLLFFIQSQMSSYKQIKVFLQIAKGEQIPKNTILVPDWLIWMFHYIDFWTLVSYPIICWRTDL